MTPPTRAVPADRYGPPPPPGAARRRTVLIAVAGVALVTVVVWLGLGLGRAPVRWQDVGFTLHGATGVEVVFDVIRLDPSVPVTCRVQALDSSYAQVGVIDVAVAPGSTRTERLTVDVATTATAVTGLVDGCEVAGG